jgi:hypothetical protein
MDAVVEDRARVKKLFDSLEVVYNDKAIVALLDAGIFSVADLKVEMDSHTRHSHTYPHTLAPFVCRTCPRQILLMLE